MLFVVQKFVLALFERLRCLRVTDHRWLEWVLGIELRLEMLPPFLTLRCHFFLAIQKPSRAMR